MWKPLLRGCAGMDAAADVAWDDLAASERAAVIFTHMAGAVGAPQAFKFLARIRTIASKRGPGACCNFMFVFLFSIQAQKP